MFVQETNTMKTSSLFQDNTNSIKDALLNHEMEDSEENGTVRPVRKHFERDPSIYSNSNEIDMVGPQLQAG